MTVDAQHPPAAERLLYRSDVAVSLGGGPDKLVQLPHADEPVVMGAHGALAEFLGIDRDAFAPHASTLDFVVGATAACLAGTFARTLRARGIEATAETLEARASGEIVLDGDVPVVRGIHVAYRLRVADARAAL